MQLRLLKRICSEYNDSSAFKILYYSLIRYYIDYVSYIT